MFNEFVVSLFQTSFSVTPGPSLRQLTPKLRLPKKITH